MYTFFFNDTATTEIYTLSLHDALPISTSFRTESATATNNIIWSSNITSPTASGGPWSDLFHAKFNFAGGDNFVNSPTGTLTWNLYPFNNNAVAGRKVQLLYPAPDVNGSGPITGIGFPVGFLTTAQAFTVNIKLGHSTLASFVDGNFSDSYSDTPVTVASNLTFTVPAGVPADEFVWVPVNGSFNYNGADNLILEIETTDNIGVTTDIGWRIRSGVGTNKRLFGGLGSTTGTAGQQYYFTKFRFNGGTMDVLTSGGGFLVPFNGSTDHVLQVLYGAKDLGTGAQIDKVAFRLSADSMAEDYTGFSVVLGHTTNTALSATLADNLDDYTNVFSGTMNIPAGLKAGDWVEIPVSGFTYNPLKNLVVQVTANMGTGNVTNPIFAGNRAISGSGVASIGSPTFDLATGGDSAALRLWYTKY